MIATRQWILRLLCVALLSIFSIAYQTKALAWEKQRTENLAAIEAVERHNAEILAQQAQAAQAQAAETTGRCNYADGSYTGSAMGFGGPIELCVTLSQDRISDIQILKHDQEDAVYFEEAITILDRILAAQSTEVDTVAGATFSSTGILEAVNAALLQAEVGT